MRIPDVKYGIDTVIPVGEDEKCMICMEEFEVGDTIKRLRCKHLYHSKCISKWLKQKKTCPICN